MDGRTRTERDGKRGIITYNKKGSCGEPGLPTSWKGLAHKTRIKDTREGQIECEIIKGRKRDCFNMAYEDCKWMFDWQEVITMPWFRGKGDKHDILKYAKKKKKKWIWLFLKYMIYEAVFWNLAIKLGDSA